MGCKQKKNTAVCDILPKDFPIARTAPDHGFRQFADAMESPIWKSQSEKPDSENPHSGKLRSGNPHPQNIDCHINKTGYDNPRLPKPSPIRAPYIGIEASCMNHEMIQITLIISTAPYD